MKEIKFHKPNIDSAELRNLTKVIKSGWLTTGAEVKKFEKEFNYKNIITNPYKKNKKIISSTFIRNKIRSGKINEINKLLNRNWCIEGKTAFFFDDPYEFRLKLQNYLADPDYRRQIQEECAMTIRKLINNEKQAKVLEKFLQNLI